MNVLRNFNVFKYASGLTAGVLYLLQQFFYL